MANRLFIGGLAWAVDDQRLKAVFAEYGELSEARVILDRETGRSRGFGFVTFESAEAATRAMAADGREVEGRNIRVGRATEKERRPAPAGGGRPSGGRDRPDRSSGFGSSQRESGQGNARDGGHREAGRDGRRDGHRGDRGEEESSRRAAPRGRRRGGRGARGSGRPGGGDDFED